MNNHKKFKILKTVQETGGLKGETLEGFIFESKEPVLHFENIRFKKCKFLTLAAFNFCFLEECEIEEATVSNSELRFSRIEGGVLAQCDFRYGVFGKLKTEFSYFFMVEGRWVESRFCKWRHSAIRTLQKDEQNEFESCDLN